MAEHQFKQDFAAARSAGVRSPAARTGSSLPVANLGGAAPSRFDPLLVLGLCVAVGAVLLAQQIEGGAMATLVHGPAFLIVVGGSCGALLVQTPWPVLLRTIRISRWLVAAPRPDSEGAVRALVDWARVARKDGLLALERLLAQQNDPFLFRGLQLLVDGTEPEVMRRTLEIDIDAREGREMEAVAVYESLGGYAPTIGIIGAVLGLIQVLGSLEDPSTLGHGIAVAFVATIYGVGLANLVLLPLAGRLRSAVQEVSRYQDLITEGLTAIAEGENPRVVEYRLLGLAR
jgi:chemotaxis protein MotA